MSPGSGFLVFFALTLVLLAAVAVSGLMARRKVHIPCVVLMLAALGFTIHYAYELGKIYDLKSAGIITPIHLTLAKLTTAAFLAPIATGIRTIFVPSTRKLHRKLAFTVLAMTVLCAITGTIMILRAQRFPA
jgi:hypothetical protein